MKKVAIFIADNIYNRKGMMNAQLNRISHLKKISNFNIDVFTFQTYTTKLFKFSNSSLPKRLVINDISINIKWRKFSFIDYILTTKLHKKPIINNNWELKYMSEFKDYDLIIANSRNLGYLAYRLMLKYNIPYYVTWHGTDIHTAPFTNSYLFKKTKFVLEGAVLNFMVSKALLETSKKISSTANSIVLYNGVNNAFIKYSDSARYSLKDIKGVRGKKIVAFAGHLIEVKNPQLLPEIFNNVMKMYQQPIEFWIMGTGKMREYIEEKCKHYGLPLKMWGNIAAEEMPDMLNCVDVLVLPSRNEGLPLIAIEAIACGANAVGARVGGIPEVMGDENTFYHGDNFVSEISKRIAYMLCNNVVQKIPSCFTWEEIAVIENNIYLDYFKCE